MYDTICLTVRIVIACLCVPIVLMSWRDFIMFPRAQTLRNGICAVSLLLGVSSGTYQLRYLLDDVQGAPPSAQLLLSLTLTMAALVVCLLLVLRVRRYPRGSMVRIEANIDVALAITDLAQLRPDQAEELAEEARRQVAVAMMENARGD